MDWMKKLLNDLSILLPIIVVLWFMSRPRKPKAIYAHFNRMIRITLFWFVLSVIVMVETWMLLTFQMKIVMPSLLQNMFPFLMIGYIILAGVYVFYWSQPFSRKRTGVKAVDEAVERYRKPGERAVGIIGGWCPDLVVDGKAYKLITYAPKDANSIAGLLAFDDRGAVVADLPLMEKIKTCFQLAVQFVNPENINERTGMYVNAMKAQKSWQTTMGDYASVTQAVSSGSDKMAEAVWQTKETLEIAQRMNAALMEYFEFEALWGNQRGNTQLKAVTYEEAVAMNGVWREKLGWLLGSVEKFISGMEAGKKLLRAMEKKPEMGKATGSLQVLLSESLPRFKKLGDEWSMWKESGKVRDRYYGKLEQDEERAWRSRLAWVEQVDRQAGRTA